MPDLLTHFNSSAIQKFQNFQTENAGNAEAIAGMNKDGTIGKTGDRSFANAVFRSDTEKAHNNAVRTQLLQSLGAALEINGARTTTNGTVCFSKKFIGELQKLLGDSFKMEDFGFSKDGAVTSGKPLTQRRISAIMAKVQEVGQARMAASNAIVGDSHTLQQVRDFADYVHSNGTPEAEGFSRGVQNAALMLQQVDSSASKNILEPTGKPGEWSVRFGDKQATVRNSSELAAFFQENLGLKGFKPDLGDGELSEADPRIINRNLHTKLENHVEKSLTAFNLNHDVFLQEVNFMSKFRGSSDISTFNEFFDHFIAKHQPQA